MNEYFSQIEILLDNLMYRRCMAWDKKKLNDEAIIGSHPLAAIDRKIENLLNQIGDPELRDKLQTTFLITPGGQDA